LKIDIAWSKIDFIEGFIVFTVIGIDQVGRVGRSRIMCTGNAIIQILSCIFYEELY
jgi:hypothetical protein